MRSSMHIGNFHNKRGPRRVKVLTVFKARFKALSNVPSNLGPEHCNRALFSVRSGRLHEKTMTTAILGISLSVLNEHGRRSLFLSSDSLPQSPFKQSSLNSTRSFATVSVFASSNAREAGDKPTLLSRVGQERAFRTGVVIPSETPPPDAKPAPPGPVASGAGGSASGLRGRGGWRCAAGVGR
jgi:hypothetical protein